MKPMKQFSTTAPTKKGVFQVVITVEYNGLRWETSATVFVDGVEMAADWNRGENLVRSFEVANHFGVSGVVALSCDCSEVNEHIQSAEIARWVEIDENMRSQDAMRKISNL